MSGQRLVGSHGFHGCGINDITEAAGVPKGSFYQYFESKETYAVDLLEDYWASIEERHGPILLDRRLKPVERVAKYFKALTQDHRQRKFTLGCLIGNLGIELSEGSEEARAKLNVLLKRWAVPLKACLLEAQAADELRSDLDAGELAAALIDAWEGAVMRGKIEQAGGAYRRFEKIVLPRLLG